jgi:hypothetical protein
MRSVNQKSDIYESSSWGCPGYTAKAKQPNSL